MGSKALAKKLVVKAHAAKNREMFMVKVGVRVQT
jgi:hypothetical protein